VPRRAILACLFSLLALGLTGRTVDASPGDDSLSFLYTASKNYEPLAWMHGAERFSSGATVFVLDVHGQHALVADFAASADPAVSFDGQRLLFAGKQSAQDSWQVWEIALAGGKPLRITSCPEDCIRPLYLPEDRIVYARKVGGHFLVESAPLSGGKPLPLTYGPANALPTDVLRDGRILFESEFASESQTVPEIYTVYSDGSGVESYRCDHGKVRHSAKQSGSGDIILVSDGGLARFTSARAQQLPISAPAGEYAGDIAETPQGSWLLSWRSDADSKFQLMFWTPGAANLHPVLANAGLNLIQPVLLVQRPIPNRHPSGLHDWPNANLLCLNAYTSKQSFAAGSIRSVRLYTRDDTGEARLLGTAPVEEDGSFFVQVTNEQPLQVELLDAAGRTLKREAGYFWMRRGEQRVCVGCHAGPETAPENAVPMTLLKSTTPADMTGKTAQSAAGGH
jgi:Hydrazine synthase alpha subunit middle domain